MTAVVLLTLRLGAFSSQSRPQYASAWELTIAVDVEGRGDALMVETALPLSDAGQKVLEETVRSRGLAFRIVEGSHGERRGRWTGTRVDGSRTLTFTAIVQTSPRRFELRGPIPKPARYPDAVQRFLLPEPEIQSADPEIVELARRLVPPDRRGDVAAILHAAFDYAHQEIASAPFRGTTDAMTCLRLGEASCGGKTRLLVALLRAADVPARLVGGLILKNGSWRSTHLWAEAWVTGRWFPLCPLNGHFGTIPETYVALYRGDQPQFLHTASIRFDHEFRAHLVFSPDGQGPLFASSGLGLWRLFKRHDLPIELLELVLLLPIGALVVAAGRNLVGVETFGTFSPALLALAFLQTGLLWGTALFALMIATGTLARLALARFHLLRAPRLAVLLTFVVAMLLVVTVVGLKAGIAPATRAAVFPLAILTLMIERFSAAIEEEGTMRALGVAGGTLAVAAVAFGAMSWSPIRITVLAFPELQLFVVALFFVAGRWHGLRLVELVRFRHIADTAESVS